MDFPLRLALNLNHALLPSVGYLRFYNVQFDTAANNFGVNVRFRLNGGTWQNGNLAANGWNYQFDGLNAGGNIQIDIENDGVVYDAGNYSLNGPAQIGCAPSTALAQEFFRVDNTGVTSTDVGAGGAFSFVADSVVHIVGDPPSNTAVPEFSDDGGSNYFPADVVGSSTQEKIWPISGLPTPNAPLRVRWGAPLNCEYPIQDIATIIGTGFSPLVATVDNVIGATSPTLCDGSITLAVSGGSGNYTFLWNDSDTNQNRSGLCAGSYSVQVTDTTTLEVIVIDPIIVPSLAEDGTILKVPLLNGVRFVDIGSPQDPDNTLFNDEVFEGFFDACYAQKFLKADVITIQFFSDWSNHLVELLDNTNATIATFPTLEVFDASATAGVKFYEFQIDFGAIAAVVAGETYQIRVTALGTTINDIRISEIIEIATTAPECLKVSWFNDETYGEIYWPSGIRPFIRIQSRLFKRLPSSEKGVFLDCDDTTKILSRINKRRFRFEVWQLPPYLHEILQWAFSLDCLVIEEFLYIAAESWDEPAYITRYPLANSSIILEQKESIFNRLGANEQTTDQDLILINNGVNEEYLIVDAAGDELLLWN